MGRDVRKVPKDWQHPTDGNDKYIPLLEYPFSKILKEWEEEKQMWKEGYRKDFLDSPKWIPKSDDELMISFEEWAGEKPQKDNFMPEWDESEKTHLQMYETTSEGKPISPVMETPEELAKWLADNNASAFANMTATYEQWLNTIKQGFAMSAIIENGEIKSGVEDN